MSGEGVDRTLLHGQLRMTRAQRLQSMIRGVRNMERLFRALRPGLAPNDTFRALHNAAVDYVLIGTFAGVVWGASSVPMALQICFDDAPENREKLARAFELPAAPAAGFFQVAAVDCFATPPGTTGYADLARHAVSIEAEDVPVPVASLDDVMRIMRASGTPKDRVELEILAALKEERDRHPPASE